MKIKYGGWFYKMLTLQDTPFEGVVPRSRCGVYWRLLWLYPLILLLIVSACMPLYVTICGEWGVVLSPDPSLYGLFTAIGIVFDAAILMSVGVWWSDNIDFTKYCGKVEITHGEGDDA